MRVPGCLEKWQPISAFFYFPRHDGYSLAITSTGFQVAGDLHCSNGSHDDIIDCHVVSILSLTELTTEVLGSHVVISAPQCWQR